MAARLDFANEDRVRGFRGTPLVFFGVASGLAVGGSACGPEEDPIGIFRSPEWMLSATVEPESRELVIDARFKTIHGNDFVHFSVRKVGHDNAYPGRTEAGVDWTRPNRFFGELHRDTYLEGSVYPGPGDYERPPREFRDYQYRLSLDRGPRRNWPDQYRSRYNYTTQLYGVYDDQPEHPGFGPGEYEIELYAWYTGDPNDLHPAVGDETKVQYIHYEHEIAIVRFRIE